MKLKKMLVAGIVFVGIFLFSTDADARCNQTTGWCGWTVELKCSDRAADAGGACRRLVCETCDALDISN